MDSKQDQSQPMSKKNLIDLFKVFLKGNFQAIASYGSELALNGKYEQAIEYLSLALLLNPFDPRLYFNRATCYLELDKLDKALIDILDCIKMNPLWAKGFFKLGQIFARMGFFKEAEMSYKKVLSFVPNCKETANQIRGNIYDYLISEGFDEIRSGYASEKYFSIEDAKDGLLNGAFEHNLNIARSIKRKQIRKLISKKGILFPMNFY